MESLATILACVFFTLLGLSASGFIGMHLLPPSLLAPFLQLRAGGRTADEHNHGAEFSGPEGPLVQRLRKVNVVREPETAQALHSAIGNILRASGTQSKEALKHFEAARDAAVRGTDPDTKLASYLDVAEAYIEEGRALDSQHELAVASGVLANHFEENHARLNRGRGRAKFELGWTAVALEYFEEAAKSAVQPEDKVRVACDIAMAHTCLGQANKAVKTLREALDVLHAARKTSNEQLMPDDLHSALAADVHFRLAEAFHSSKNSAFAKAHYSKALNLLQKLSGAKAKRVSAIRRGIKYLEHGIDPELHCPRKSNLPWDKAPATPLKDATFVTKINLLLAEHRYDKAEEELKASLNTQSRPYKTLEASKALNILGDMYRKQSSFSKAAKQFRQALHAAIVCCGAGSDAQTAYEGLRDVRTELSAEDQRVADATIDRYFDVLKKGTLANGHHETEENRRVQTSSQGVTIA